MDYLFTAIIFLLIATLVGYHQRVKALKQEILDRELGFAQVIDGYEQDFLTYKEHQETTLAIVERQRDRVVELEAQLEQAHSHLGLVLDEQL